jgi:steroid delta-isomerase-like uncharacterized protein
MTTSPKDIAASYLDAFNDTDTAALSRIMAPDFLDHDPLAPGLPPGAEGEIVTAKAVFTGFPDVHATLDDVLAEGDKVVTRITWTGTHKGEFMGIPATGKSVKFTEIHIQRVVDGKIVEHWSVLDQLTMLRQLGVIPT